MDLSVLAQKYLKNGEVVSVDVGSLDGLKVPWRDIQKIVKHVAIEPQEKDGGGIAISDTVGMATMYMMHHTDNTSLLLPNTEFMQQFGVATRYEIASKEDVEIVTLDAWLQAERVERVDFLKIDTQGSERMVLMGAEKALRSTLGVDVEVNFAERYKGQAFFSDIDAQLRQAGFMLFDLQRRYFKRKVGLRLGGPKGQLTHGTALYLRSPESFGRLIAGLSDAEKRVRVVVFIIIALLYGYDDYALAILGQFGGALSDSERAELEAAIDTDIRWGERLSRFPLRGYLAGAFTRLARLFRIPSSKGNSGDPELGNAL